jgi:hypothetical protein
MVGGRIDLLGCGSFRKRCKALSYCVLVVWSMSKSAVADSFWAPPCAQSGAPYQHLLPFFKLSFILDAYARLKVADFADARRWITSDSACWNAAITEAVSLLPAQHHI